MNTPRKTFKKKILAQAVASYALISFSSLAVAQTTAGDNVRDPLLVEEVLVTGVKAAQETAVNTKRLAESIVDGISAEDIGKLPDTTITDSLQRITGVQIQRSAGEGSSLSIRGMQQVGVMLNGEQFLAAGNLASAQPNFNDVPAQLLRSATVYKTLDVRNAYSGITGTINIETFRPYDFEEGFTVSAGYDLSTGEVTQEADSTFNGLINWRGDNIGVMVSGVTGQKNLANDYQGRFGTPVARQLGEGSEFAGSYIATTDYGYEFFHAADERNRDGLNVALQADLGDSLELVVEGFYTDAKQYQRRAGLSLNNRWQGQSLTSDYMQSQWVTDELAQIAAPTGISDEITGADGRHWVVGNEYYVEPLWVRSLSSNRVISQTSKNFNLELNYDNGGPLTGSFRAISGSARDSQLYPTVEGTLNSHDGNTGFNLDGFFYPADVVADWNLTLDPTRAGDVGVNGGRFIIPNPEGYDEDPRLGLALDGHDMYWSGFDRELAGGLGAGATLADYMANKDSYMMAGLQLETNTFTESTLKAVSIDLNYEFEDSFITDIDVGVRRSDRMADFEQYDYWARFYPGSDTYLTGPDNPNANNIDGCYAQWRSIDQRFDGGPTGSECYAGERLDENDPASFTPYWALPPVPLDAFGADLQWVTDLGEYTHGIPGFYTVDPRSFDDPVAFHEQAFGKLEKITHPGQSYTIDIEELSGYIYGNFEAGIVSGNVGVRVIETSIDADIYRTSSTTRANGGTPYHNGREVQSKSDTYVLPSLNMAITPTDNITVRVAAAKNKQELDLFRYGSSLTVYTVADPEDPTRRVPSGWNSVGDVNLEPWETNNYDLSLEYYFGAASMAHIGAYYIDIDAFVETSQRERTFDWNGETFTILGNGPVMGEGGNVKGLEVGTKLALGDFLDGDSLWSYFGIDANYTYSPSERPGVASDVTGELYPFADNSEHTYNFVVWYEQDRLQARVALNGRSERFVQDHVGEYGFATYAPSESYLDASISYDVTDEVTVYLQGSNLTSTDYKQVYRLADGVEQNAFVYSNEARYSLGVRATF